MTDNRQAYRQVIDELVRACREGQGQVAVRRTRVGVWNKNADDQPEQMPDQAAMNDLLRRLGPGDREVIATRLEQAFVGGVHQALVTLYEHGVEPFEDGYEGTPFHDFVGRMDGWQWPIHDPVTPSSEGAGAGVCQVVSRLGTEVIERCPMPSPGQQLTAILLVAMPQYAAAGDLAAWENAVGHVLPQTPNGITDELLDAIYEFGRFNLYARFDPPGTARELAALIDKFTAEGVAVDPPPHAPTDW
jgi:hypothetical protein